MEAGSPAESHLCVLQPVPPRRFPTGVLARWETIPFTALILAKAFGFIPLWGHQCANKISPPCLTTRRHERRLSAALQVRCVGTRGIHLKSGK
ncbi:hypothetical protein GN956_G5501 [Arapaima gigas]